MTQNLTGSSVCSTTLSTEDARTLGRDLQNQVQVPESVGAGSSPLHPTQTLRDTSAATSHPPLDIPVAPSCLCPWALGASSTPDGKGLLPPS